jgi:hypothetical protein
MHRFFISLDKHWREKNGRRQLKKQTFTSPRKKRATQRPVKRQTIILPLAAYFQLLYGTNSA